MAPDSINKVGGEISVNGRVYRLPKQPTVVVCIDGAERSEEHTSELQ